MDLQSLRDAAARMAESFGNTATPQPVESNTQPATQLWGEGEDKPNTDGFVRSVTDGQKPEGAKNESGGYYTSMDDIPEPVINMLKNAAGGDITGYNGNEIWIQEKAEKDGNPATVTFGFTMANGERMWVRYEKTEDDNLVESKRTIDSEAYGKLSSGKEVDNSKEPHAVLAKEALAASLGVPVSELTGMTMQTLEGKNEGSFVYSAKDAQGNTTYIKVSPDGNGGYEETARTYKDPSGNRTSFYNINSEKVRMVKQEKGGEEQEFEITQAAFKNIIGNIPAEFSMATMVPLTNDKDGFTTYSIKGKDGGEMWVRLTDEGEVTARTFKDADGNRTSFYMPGDTRNDGNTVILHRETADGEKSDVEINKDEFDQIRRAAGDNFDIRTLSDPVVSGNGFKTYEIKGENGTKMWIRFDKDGNELARTIEDSKGTHSLYHPGDSNKTASAENFVLVERDKDGNETHRTEIPTDVMAQIEKAAGNKYDIGTLIALKNDAEGFQTYELHAQDGTRMWLRFNKDGKETARTVEIEKGVRQSVYAEDDNRAGNATGKDGQVTVITAGQEDSVVMDGDTSYESVVEGFKNMGDLMNFINGSMSAEDLNDMPDEVMGDAQQAKLAYTNAGGDYNAKFQSEFFGKEITIMDWLTFIGNASINWEVQAPQ